MWSLPTGCELRADGFLGGEGSDEGLPMTTFFTRCTTLGVTVAGALSALAACASDIRPLADSTGSASPSEAATASETASASASASASRSASESASAASGLRSSGGKYKGIITFENYVENGKYVVATATNPADNVPRPAPPENINEHSIDGAYAFLSFWLARLNHLMISGDPGPIEMVCYKGYSWEKYQSTIKLYASHWLGVRYRNSVYC